MEITRVAREESSVDKDLQLYQICVDTLNEVQANAGDQFDLDDTRFYDLLIEHLQAKAMGAGLDFPKTTILDAVIQQWQMPDEPAWHPEIDDMPECHMDDLDGSELMISSSSEMLERIDEYINAVAMLQREYGAALSPDLIDQGAIAMVQEISSSARNERRMMSEKDALYAQAVQDWVIAELRQRQEARGYEYEHTSPESYAEALGVISELKQELLQDHEDPKLIAFVSTWHTEIHADLIEVSMVEMFNYGPAAKPHAGVLSVREEVNLHH